MNNKPPIKRFDGEYEIIFSETFNVYEDFLRIHNIGFLHEIFDIRIEFQKQDPQENQPSIQASWVRQDGKNELQIVCDKKFRNSLGVSTSNKIEVLRSGDQAKALLFSLYGSSTDDNFMNVTITIYAK